MLSALVLLGALAAPNTARVALAETTEQSAQAIERGRRIYEAGQLGSGEPLRAQRGEQGMAVNGRAAACVNCHQRSGFGLFEASNLVPPVTGPSLFSNAQPRPQTPRRAKGMEHQEFSFLTRPPYDDLSLARALSEGISPSGQRLQYLMPRYALNDADMAALIAYLRQLSFQPSPGIDRTVAHFATVVAANQDAGRRQALLEVLEACFRERHPPGAAGQAWHLSVWDLTGAPETWEAQLSAKLREQPVFALLSGLGGDEWDPVQRFAEREKIPSLFPNLTVPPAAPEGGYSFYFSRGAMLEAEVLAQYLRETSSPFRRLVQLHLETGPGPRAAVALRRALEGQPQTIEDRPVRQATAEAMAAGLADLGPSDVLVLWLEAGQLKALAELPPPNVGRILLSGGLGGLERAPLSAAWKPHAFMIYPVDAPQRREARMGFNLRPWLRKHAIQGTDEILLGNTLAACSLLAESVSRLRGSYFRDYLVEMIENYPTGMGNAPAAQAFPRFTLGPGQRYSSKGAYIVKFKDANGGELELVHDWLVPP
jgi:hypothetical protein